MEKLQHDEKETKKLQENLQSMQLRLAARESKCRSLQEKVTNLSFKFSEYLCMFDHFKIGQDIEFGNRSENLRFSWARKERPD